MKAKELNMTEGQIGKQILLFAVPLLIGNLFQQLYNTVDSVIVGNFVGRQALAAVGSSVSLINLIIGFFIGIATGASILIAQYYGGKQADKLKWAVHTAIALSIIGGIILTFAGVLISRHLLIIMGTPDEVIASSTLYLKIFFLGSVFNLTYNMGAGILRAVGDSKNPLYYLIAASIVNILLDILFVVVFRMGVAGVGLATIMAQAVSAILVIRKLMKADGGYKFILKELKIDGIMSGRIIKLGVPSGLQSSVISLSNVVVQANINSFGAVAMAGCSSYTKIDGFVMLPIMSFSMAAMTFIGQNIGAGKYDRAKKGLYTTILISCIYVCMASAGLLLFGKHILGIFTGEPDVVSYGMRMLHTLAPFYILITVAHIICGGLRGAGNAFSSMVIMIVNLCFFRMLWVHIMLPFYPTIETVFRGYPVTWTTAFICCVFYIWKGNWLKPKNL